MEEVRETHIGIVQQITMRNDRTLVLFNRRTGTGKFEQEFISFFDKGDLKFATWFKQSGIREGSIAAINVCRKGSWIKGQLVTNGGIVQESGKNMLVGTIWTDPRRTFDSLYLSIPVRVKCSNGKYESRWAFLTVGSSLSAMKGQQVIASIKDMREIPLRNSTGFSCLSDGCEIY